MRLWRRQAPEWRPVLCLDFDGVLHSHDVYGKTLADIPGPPVTGAMDFVVGAQDKFTVAIYSYRSRRWSARRAMQRWMRLHLTRHFAGDESAADAVLRQIQWPWLKPAASVTLDDRALTFRGTWPAIADLVAFRPWNR